jgi:hypothetical protein
MTTEVASLVQRDKGAPAMKMEKGARTTKSVCVGEADAKQPPVELLALEGLACEYRDSYVRSGRLNATLACTGRGAAAMFRRS